MRCAVLVVLVLTSACCAQNSAKSATVPIAIDHNRVVINVDLPLPDGSTTPVRGWVDNGNPDLYLSHRVATLMGLNVSCGQRECSAPPPREVKIGGMTISLAAVKQAKIPLTPADSATAIAPGLSVEINLPSTILRNYDVLINFPDHEFTIALTGNLKFKGVTAKAILNAENGLVQIPSQIENKKYNLALDLGSSISFLSEELFDKLSAAHPDWPHMTGAVGPANMWGLPDEPARKLMRLDRVQFGPLYLTDVPFERLGALANAIFGDRGGLPTAGLIGSEALLNYRVGLDYAHSTVYFDIGRLFNVPDFDVIGLILRSEKDGSFNILGVADFDAKLSVNEIQAGDHLIAVDGIPVAGSSMGQVWSMLAGEPGKERKLTIERSGKQFMVVAQVRHFLGEVTEGRARNESSKKK